MRNIVQVAFIESQQLGGVVGPQKVVGKRQSALALHDGTGLRGKGIALRCHGPRELSL